MIKPPAMPPAVAPACAPSLLVASFSCCAAKKPAMPPAISETKGPQKPRNPATQIFNTKPIPPTISPILILGCMSVSSLGFHYYTLIFGRILLIFVTCATSQDVSSPHACSMDGGSWTPQILSLLLDQCAHIGSTT